MLPMIPDVQYAEYDARYPVVFDRLRALVESAAPGYQLEHVGSTSVPGLGGRPIIDTALVAPESYGLDSALLARPGNDEIQLDLFLDYASNVALYPKFQEYFRNKRPPLLAV